MLKGAVLYAKNLDTLSRFYIGIGGTQTDGVVGAFVALATSDAELIILQIPMEIASQIEIKTPPTVRSATPVKPIISVESIDDVLQILSELGGMTVPASSPWKYRKHLVQDVVDPKGNVIQLWQSV